MDDLISRQLAIDALREAENHAFNSYYKGLIKAHKIIADLPSAEHEIIHCKDCIHWINKHLCEIWSRYGTIETKSDFYCGFGVRKNNE